ncbi:MAG: GAF domain-containing protein [Calditrichaeota bacterium]|nr:GAF domain-containing protein [Calditrichota bacterium]
MSVNPHSPGALEEQILQGMQKFSAEFNQITLLLATEGKVAEARQALQRLFREFLHFHQLLAGDIQKLSATVAREQEKNTELIEENQRLNTLITALIGFSGHMRGKKAMMENILDTLARTLATDSSYVLLTDDEGNVSYSLGRNMDAVKEREVQDWSRTIIRETLKGSRPQTVHVNGDRPSGELPHSMLKLQIKAAMCVPICIEGRCLGVVYVDRRHSDRPFTNSELGFLMKFSSLMARALQVSIYMENLQSRILSKLVLSRKELDDVFHCPDLVGHSRALLDVLRVAAQVAPTDVPVLITGESGTGKELMARAIHQNSLRRDQPFVTINCGAIPENLLESELFGYEAGAFTGARRAKPGKISLAHRGTLFLDEIGELHPSLQSKLLRVLQFGELEPLGGTTPQHVDVRIIAATNRDLREMIHAGQFREDLYYRLRVIELHLPALSERREDIPELVDYFIQKHAPEGRHFRISESAIGVLENYNWPGNVRELENVIQRALILCQEDTITPNDLPTEIRTPELDALSELGDKTLAEAEREFRRLYITRILRSSKTKAEAARRLGVNRSYLYKLLEEFGLHS